MTTTRQLAGPLTTRTLAANLGTICFTEPAVLNLCVYRGDSGLLAVTVTNPDGSPYDVTSADWASHIRATPDGTLVTELKWATP